MADIEKAVVGSDLDAEEGTLDIAEVGTGDGVEEVHKGVDPEELHKVVLPEMINKTTVSR